jgi:hypothetical protein
MDERIPIRIKGQGQRWASPRKIWAAAPAIVRATLHAAWAASKVGALFLATLFTIANLAFGVYEAAQGRMKILELPGIIVGGVATFALALLFSFVITVPVSSVVATCAYPFLRALQAIDQRLFGVVGFLVGVLVWSVIWWNGPTGNLYFGSWISVLVVGGPAGCAGGLAFARHLSREQ